MIKEQHFRGGWSDKYTIAVDRYIKDRGLDLMPVLLELKDGKTATRRDIIIARELAVQAERLPNTRDVVITVLDADTIPENDRNSPIDMREGSKPIGIDSLGFPVYPKKRTNLDGNEYYDWRPITEKELYDLRKKKTFSITLEEMRRKYRR